MFQSVIQKLQCKNYTLYLLLEIKYEKLGCKKCAKKRNVQFYHILVHYNLKEFYFHILYNHVSKPHENSKNCVYFLYLRIGLKKI